MIVHFGTDKDGATATVDEIERAGGTAFAVGAELGVDGDVETLFAGVEAGLAGRPLDILVNNAAAAPAGPLGATTRAEFDHLFAVNVRAPYFIIQRALPLLRDGGRIITISSVATRMANPTQTSFAMTKGAVETMSMTLANELGARGITVNAVAPGATRTATNGSSFEAPGLAELHRRDDGARPAGRARRRRRRGRVPGLRRGALDHRPGHRRERWPVPGTARLITQAG